MDSDEDETFVSLGTPLELIDEDEPRKKPVHELPVKDKKGRQRFHGAFTGGFSAGYFNTVGSKEGFTPSNFVSSREKKPETDEFTLQRPEDFMDDEDFEEHGIAPRKLVTSQIFASEERKRRRQDDAKSLASDSVIGLQPALLDLIVPERLTIGIKLLRKLGWKEGQGIGKREKRRKKKQKNKSSGKTYGCALPSSSGEDEEIDTDEEDFLKDITFAPKDVTPLSLKAKDNVHGIGYSGIDPRSALPSTHINLFDAPPVSKSGRKGIKGQAFGVGALEDDDDDIYAVDHMSNYDMTMEIDDGSEKLYGWTAPGRRGKGQQNIPIGYIGKVLEGFTLSSKTLKPKKTYPAPQLPRDFRPFHHFSHQSQSTVAVNKDKQELNAISRGMELGETPIFESVFDLISKQDKEKIETVKTSSRFVRPSASDDEPSHISTSSHVTTSSAVTADKSTRGTTPLFQGGLNLFKPFAKDPDKQERYEKYLNLSKQGRKDAYEENADHHMTEWDREREKEEFMKASKLYKPLSGMMASRFTTAKHDDESKIVETAASDSSVKDDKINAAKMKMYGRLTRESFDWHPDRLLCRRFNVPDPYPGSGIVGIPGLKRDKYSVFDFLTLPSQISSEHTTEMKAITHTQSLTDTEENVGNKSAQKDDYDRSRSTLTTQDKTLAQNCESDRQSSSKDRQSSKGKPVSIFSHLVGNTSTTTQVEQSVAFPHASESQPKQQTKSTDITESENIPEQTETDEEKPPVDLFRAIFRNTDSEESSDSDVEGETSKENEKSVKHDTGQIAQLENDGDGSIQTSDHPLSPLRYTEKPLSTQSGTINIQTLEERLSPPDVANTEKEEDSYGPALPPLVGSLGNPSSTEVIDLTKKDIDYNRKKKHKQRDKDKHKHKKQKKVKHKSKHKKKEKKRKLTKKERDREDSGSDSSSSGSDLDDVPSDRDLLHKLKSINSGRRLKASDFM